MEITSNDYYQLPQRLLAPLTLVGENGAVKAMMERRGIEERLYDYRCRAAVHNFGPLQTDALCYVTTVGSKAVAMCFEAVTTGDIDRVRLDDDDAGSANPSYTVVSVLKVRDQEICHTGRMYYIRMASGRYVEMKGEKECQEHLRKTIIHGTDLAAPWIDVR